ncbi:MAG: PAS domain S-box protein [Candidatus Krumholzibacteriota bacterium]|nr:PAS domain S-box protein [Candidatus Krumholzibacteriota bacterium]
MQPSKYLAKIFDSSPVAMVSLDTRLRIMLFNRLAMALTGFTNMDLAGKRVTKLISLEKVKEIIDLYRNEKDFESNGHIAKLRRAEGRDIPVRIKLSLIKDSEDRLVGILILALDMREIKELQSKLIEAERLKAISETAISVNHEINNPLCSILSNTQLMLMQRENLDPNIEKKLRSIEKQISRIQDIAKQIGKINDPVLKEYIGGKKMLDVERSGKRSKNLLKK